MNKKKLHIDIDEEIKFKLDELSKNRGMKTNELIRFILSEYLLKKGNLLIKESYVRDRISL